MQTKHLIGATLRLPAALLLPTALLLASPAALAAKDLGYYAGGQATHNALEDKIGDFDESAWGLGAYGGYNFTDSFGMELTLYGTDSFVDPGDLKVSALTLAPTLRHAYSDSVTAYIKAGLVYQVISSDYDLDDYNGTGWLFGLGVDYSLSQSLALRVFFELSEISPESDALNNYFADTRIDQFGLGLHYRF
jgi:outer membrane immunogenic protein